MKGRSKYHNRKIDRDGEKFDSLKEYRRWKALKLLQEVGEISELSRQVHFELLPDQRVDGKLIERKWEYIADFTYRDKDGTFIVEDVKGMKTRDYIKSRKMMLWKYGIRILET